MDNLESRTIFKTDSRRYALRDSDRVPHAGAGDSEGVRRPIPTSIRCEDGGQNKKKPRVLFVGESVSLAHSTRPLVLARALDPAQFNRIVACDTRHQGIVEADGLTWRSLPSLDPEVFMRRLKRGQPLYDCHTLRAQCKDDLRLIQDFKPDLIVGDFRVSMSISAKVAGVPFANLCNAHWSPYAPDRYPVPELPLSRWLGVRAAGWLLRALQPIGHRYHIRAFNQVRKAYGLRPVQCLREMYSGGDWTLYPDLESLVPTRSRPERHCYLGPVVWQPQFEKPSWWSSLPRNRPLVYVSLGSSGCLSVADALAQALAALPVTVVWATAGRQLARPLPESFFVADYLPGQELLSQADLCVFNGGAAGGYQALSQGIPLLGFPSNMDQFFFMERVEAVGVGRLLRPSRASGKRILRTLKQLLASSSLQARARQLGNDIKCSTAEVSFREFVTRILCSADSNPSATKREHAHERLCHVQ